MIYTPPPVKVLMDVVDELWEEPLMSFEELKEKYPHFYRMLREEGITAEYWETAVVDYALNRELYRAE